MADFASENPQPLPEDRPKRISKKRLQDVSNLERPKSIAIYCRSGPGKPLTPLLNKFPRDVAIIFSETVERELGEKGNLVVINTNDPEPYKKLFDWMNACAIAGDDIPFQDIAELADDAFTPTFAVMIAASKLRIPEGSLNVFLKKRLFKTARTNIIPIDTVRKIYDPLDTDFGGGLGATLQEIATMSIFEAWFNNKLDEEEYEEYMYTLSDLRDRIPQLDKDLHDAVEKKREFFKQLREKRKMERLTLEVEAAAVDGQGNFQGFSNAGWGSTNDENLNSGGGTGWKMDDESIATCVTPSMIADKTNSNGDSVAPTLSWMAEDFSPPPTERWQDSKVQNAEILTYTSGNWADEMNEEPVAAMSLRY